MNLNKQINSFLAFSLIAIFSFIVGVGLVIDLNSLPKLYASPQSYVLYPYYSFTCVADKATVPVGQPVNYSITVTYVVPDASNVSFPLFYAWTSKDKDKNNTQIFQCFSDRNKPQAGNISKTKPLPTTNLGSCPITYDQVKTYTGMSVSLKMSNQTYGEAKSVDCPAVTVTKAAPTHYECSQGMCSPIQGAGTNTCTQHPNTADPDSDCHFTVTCTANPQKTSYTGYQGITFTINNPTTGGTAPYTYDWKTTEPAIAPAKQPNLKACVPINPNDKKSNMMCTHQGKIVGSTPWPTGNYSATGTVYDSANKSGSASCSFKIQ